MNTVKKVSFIATIFNEEKSVLPFMASLMEQDILPQEIIIVDGGSSDRTISLLTGFFRDLGGVETKALPNKKVIGRYEAVPVFESLIHNAVKIKIFISPGVKISTGRNIAIKNSGNKLICVSDAGCRLDHCWLSEITWDSPGGEPSGKIIGGYSYPYLESYLQSLLATCILPKKEEVRKEKFMPSSRNISFSKEAWEKVGGYPEYMDFGEDMKFNFNLKKAGFEICFKPSAMVYWNLRDDLISIFRQFFRYAKGDAIGRMYRLRHLARFSALVIFLMVVIISILASPWFLLLFMPLLGFYLYKPYKRINYFLENPQACTFSNDRKRILNARVISILLTPFMMLYLDTAKLCGYVFGLFMSKNYRHA